MKKIITVVAVVAASFMSINASASTNKELCEAVSQRANTIMVTRQLGVPEYKMRRKLEANKQSLEDFEYRLITVMIDESYNTPIQTTEAKYRNTVVVFMGTWYKRCMDQFAKYE